MPEPIVVVDYDPSWPALFAALSIKIAGALGEVAASIEHVGSTSVPGLAAKPTIDIDVILSSPELLPEAIRRLGTLGYAHEGDGGIPGREAFAVPPGHATHHHHLYVCAPDNPALLEHIAFRDYLRAHPKSARAYGELKLSLAQQFRNDRGAYSNAKTEYVREILRRVAERR
jgi:GrpB-like predicted nucleotidyltransferase (UPF0157 family)